MGEIVPIIDLHDELLEYGRAEEARNAAEALRSLVVLLPEDAGLQNRP